MVICMQCKITHVRVRLDGIIFSFACRVPDVGLVHAGLIIWD